MDISNASIFSYTSTGFENYDNLLADMNDALHIQSRAPVNANHTGSTDFPGYIMSLKNRDTLTTFPVIFYVVPDYYLKYVLDLTGDPPLWRNNWRNITVDWSQDNLNENIPSFLKANEPVYAGWLAWKTDTTNLDNIPESERPELVDSTNPDDIDIHVSLVSFPGVVWGGFADRFHSFVITQAARLMHLRIDADQDKDVPLLNTFPTAIVFLPRSQFLSESIRTGGVNFSLKARSALRVNERQTLPDIQGHPGESIVDWQNRIHPNDNDVEVSTFINDTQFWWVAGSQSRSTVSRNFEFLPVQTWSPPDDFHRISE